MCNVRRQVSGSGGDVDRLKKMHMEKMTKEAVDKGKVRWHRSGAEE